MKDKLIIIGASGHGKVIADIAVKINKWKAIAFLDDNEEIITCLGLEIVGRVNDFLKFANEADFIVAIGNNEVRKKLIDELEKHSLSIISLIHPSAIIGTDVEIGIGTVVMAGAVINSSTSIGKGCIINTCSSIGHDNEIEDYVHISSGANIAGTVKIGKGSWIGVGSVISNNINIAEKVTTGAGAVVIKDIYSMGVYVGVPVKRIG